MAIHFLTSHRLDALQDALCKQLMQEERAVFRPWHLVTQTEGMNVWLRQQIAHCLGISANQHFYLPNRLMEQLYVLLMGRHEEHILKRYHLIWLLFDLLNPDGEFAASFPEVARYYSPAAHSQEPQYAQMKQAALATTLADLFDQYQVYRTDMIAKWRQHQCLDPQNATEQWQQWLWTKALEATQDHLPDKSAVANALIAQLKKPQAQQRLRQRFPSIHLFGLSVLTEWHVRLLHALGQVTDLHFYLLNPSPEIFWFEDKSQKFISRLQEAYEEDDVFYAEGNALLTSMGGLLQNTFGMLYRYDDFANAATSIGHRPPPPETLLQKIQTDVYDNAVGADRARIVHTDLADQSVVVVSAHTRVREIEVLYNRILTLKLSQGTTSRNVVVMTPDINEYAPYISAVFNNAPYPIAYHIADAHPANDDSWFGALKAVLTLGHEPFSAELVMSLLDFTLLRRHFGLHALPRLREYILRCGIRGGISGNADDETHLLSWQTGLKRMLYGVVMSGDLAYTSPGGTTFYPADLTEGQESMLLIRFCRFVQWLIDHLQRRSGRKTVTQWVELVQVMVQELMDAEEADDDSEEELTLRQVHEVLQMLRPGMYDGTARQDTEVAWAVFSGQLVNELGNFANDHQFARGGVTFCSLVPMRSIPFDMVAMLGMDARSFPRKDERPAYDLMRKRRLGDRSFKDNDRHLFLENLLSARQCFYLSYVGQSTKDGSVINPSIVVDELLAYIADGMMEEDGPEQVQKTLVQHHPLHHFSHKYNSSETGWYHFVHTRSTGPGPWARNPDSPLPQPDLPLLFTTYKLSGFAQFASTAYYQHRLGLQPEAELLGLPVWEPVSLSPYQASSLRRQMEDVDESTVEAFIQKQKAQGTLPLHNVGYSTAHALYAEVKAQSATIDASLAALPEQRFLIDLHLAGGLRIQGEVQGLRGQVLLRSYHGKALLVQQCKARLDLLYMAAQGFEGKLLFVGEQGLLQHWVQAPAKEEATSLLEKLCVLYQQSFVTPNGFALAHIGSWDEEPEKLEPIIAHFDPYKAYDPNAEYLVHDQVLQNHAPLWLSQYTLLRTIHQAMPLHTHPA